MILCEIDYRRAIENLRCMGEELLGVRNVVTIERIDARRDVLIGEVCKWILTRPRVKGEGLDFFAFLQSIQGPTRRDKAPLRRNLGNSTNHPGRRKVTP